MKLKKLVSVLLAFIMIALTFAACGGVATKPSDSVEESGLKLWWAYNTENFLQDIQYDYDRDSTLRFHGIKGDIESIQLMITPATDVINFDFTMGDVTSDSGAAITADCFEIYAEAYIEVGASYNTESYAGFHPDALVPIENYKFRRNNFIEAGNNQGIWINVNIPADAAAGTYIGEGTLTLDGEEHKVPVELTVYNVTMPEEVHAETAFMIWYDQIEAGEGTASTEMCDNYFWFLVDKRISPHQLEPSKSSDYSAYVDYITETLAENPAIASYGLPYRSNYIDGANHLDKDGVLELFNLMVDKNIALREAGNETVDLFKKAYYYLGSICDEPRTAAAFEIVRESDLMITEAKFEVAERLNDYPDLKESLLSVRHIVTAYYVDELVGSDTMGGVQTWCPTFQYFNTVAQRENMAARQNSTERLMGENVWWYGCLDPKAPFPTYHLDDNLISSRVISWMQYDYGIEGNLYWCVNFYKKYSAGAQGRLLDRDIWADPEVVAEVPGDGYLLYPGREYGIDGPISTLRLESIREGNEDYEYFWLFNEKIRQYNEANGTLLDTNELLQTYFAGLYKGVIPNTDTDAFWQQRIELLKALDGLYTDLDATVERLTA